ncbi:SGNH/GDSL hydrolase family protein [Verrucomicrobiales bacterium BCK34]|nr:SGNH/GDSL hydrolase family protein [Verrucomicrobiales bacterium BCK34]
MKKLSDHFQQGCRIAAALTLALTVSGLIAEEPEPSPPFQRVLFLGNSITKHGPKEKIGWSGNWGMAATSEENDFVHLVADALSKKAGTPCETMITNIAGFESKYATYDLKSVLEEALAFAPDLIILAIGENVPKLDSEEAGKLFTKRTAEFLKKLKSDDGPVILVRSCFWSNEAKDQALREVCDEVGGIFVNIASLGADESNYARSEREIPHKGVAAHPGDKGMQSIADAILKALK